MLHLQDRNLPRIVLLDCADDVVTSLASAGYDLAVGYTGYFTEHPTMVIPPALHEKDLLVVDLDPGWTPRPQGEVMPLEATALHGAPPAANHAREPRLQGKPLEAFAESLKRGAVILCLLEGVTPPPPVGEGPLRGGSFDWLPGTQPLSTTVRPGSRLGTTDVADDRYLHVPEQVVDEQPELAQLIASPVQAVKSLRTLSGGHPVVAQRVRRGQGRCVCSTRGRRLAAPSLLQTQAGGVAPAHRHGTSQGSSRPLPTAGNRLGR